MNTAIQTIIVVFLVGLAVAYLGYSLVKRWRGNEDERICGSGCGCPKGKSKTATEMGGLKK